MAERRTKYGNAQTVQGGVVYDSVLEAQVARVLDLLQKNGRIRAYGRQVSFVLAPRRGKERTVSYRADFVVTSAARGGSVFVIESRGYEPTSSRLKRRWFMDKYPDIPLRIVRAPEEVIAVIEELER